MRTALLVITDGRRDCVTRTIPSALANIAGDLTEKWLYDDSGEEDNAGWLTDCFGPLGFTVFQHPIGRQGFGGAIRYAWQRLSEWSTCDYVFHLEDDFTFNRPVSLDHLRTVLDLNAHVAQVALRRQPWNAAEIAAGGVVEQHPGDYIDRSDTFGNEWLEHSRFFTTNPCLYRMSLCEKGWPDVPHSEGVFGIGLREAGHRFAFYGPRNQRPWVTHIGHERAGVGY